MAFLFPFKTQQVRSALQRVLRDGATIREVTLARAQMNDGQSMLAFNDLFIGRRSHASARYNDDRSVCSPESQSSSGVIVATGAGSTGWLSSVFNMNERREPLARQQAVSRFQRCAGRS